MLSLRTISFHFRFTITFSTILIFTTLSADSFGQKTYEGTVKDKLTNENIGYVNIGIVNKNIGTVSDSEGKFKISIPEQKNDDSIRLSIVGYKFLQFKVSDFKILIATDNEIKLEEEITQLSEVVVSSKKLKTKKKGNGTESKKFRGGFTDSELGNELGIIINIKKRPTYIKDFNAFIVENTSDSMKFRLNFYDVKKGMPGDKIIKEQIVFPIRTKTGKFTFDLSQYNIVMIDDFFVSLELVENFGRKSKKGILFSAGFFGSPFITRETSQGTWKKYKAISLGFNLTTEY